MNWNTIVNDPVVYQAALERYAKRLSPHEQAYTIAFVRLLNAGGQGYAGAFQDGRLNAEWAFYQAANPILRPDLLLEEIAPLWRIDVIEEPPQEPMPPAIISFTWQGWDLNVPALTDELEQRLETYIEEATDHCLNDWETRGFSPRDGLPKLERARLELQVNGEERLMWANAYATLD